MGKFGNKIQAVSMIAFVAVVNTGCGLIGGKDISSGLVKTVNYSQGEPTFKEVAYGSAVGLVATPTFQAASTQVQDILGLTTVESRAITQVSPTVIGNLPEVGVATNLGPQSTFAYTKLYLAACSDKCRVDRGDAARADRLCTFDFGTAHNSATNAPRWTAAITKLAELFWGRTELTASESATLLTLRDEVGASAIAATNLPNGGTVPAFEAVCTAMALSPDALAQ